MQSGFLEQTLLVGDRKNTNELVGVVGAEKWREISWSDSKHVLIKGKKNPRTEKKVFEEKKVFSSV